MSRTDYKIHGLLLVLFGFVIFHIFKTENLEKEIGHWQNEVAKLNAIKEIAKNTYEKQSLVLKDIKLKNDKLRQRIHETGRELHYYSLLSLRYKNRLDSIPSFPVDTVYLKDTTNNATLYDRRFEYVMPNEISIKGYYQPYEPFKMFITDLDILMKLEITMSQYKDGTWWYNIDTGNELLSPEEVKVHVKPMSIKWRYNLGASILFKGFSPRGMELLFGIERGNWGVDLGFGFIEKAEMFNSLTFKKTFNF